MKDRTKRSHSTSSDAKIRVILSPPLAPQAAAIRNKENKDDSNREVLQNDLPNTIASFNAVNSVQSDIQHIGWVSDPLPASNVLHHLPPILVFIRGWLYLHEAWLIWKKDSRYKQITEYEKKVRLLTALVGGVVAVGGSIVSLLMALQVGLLATALAVTITPIILSSVSIAFFIMTLFRDLNRIPEINKKLAVFKVPEGGENLMFIQEIRAALIKEKNDIFKNIIFGSIGTAATIAFLIVMAVPTFGVCWIAAAALTAIAVSPAIYSLGKKLLGLIFGPFPEKQASIQPRQANSRTPHHRSISLPPNWKKITSEKNAFFDQEQANSKNQKINSKNQNEFKLKG